MSKQKTFYGSVTNSVQHIKPKIQILSKKIIFSEHIENIVFDMEDEISNVCRTFSIQNKNQEKNLIDTLKQNCRKIMKDKTGKKPFTNINIARI